MGGAVSHAAATMAASFGIKADVDKERIRLNEAATADIPNQLEKYKALVRCVRLFDLMGDSEVEAVARELTVHHFKEGEIIYDEGDAGHEAYVVEKGVCVAYKYVWSTGKHEFVKGRLKVKTNLKEWKEMRRYKPGKFGSFFGERSLIRKEPRQLRITAADDCKLVRISAQSYVTVARIREYKDNLIRHCELFETMTDDQVGRLAALLTKRTFAPGEAVFSEGEQAASFYIVESGGASSKGSGGASSALGPGALFGEQVLFEEASARTATVVVTGDEPFVLYEITKEAFERQLGPLPKLQAEQYAADPRKLLSDFYMAGDQGGPKGVATAKGVDVNPAHQSKWFAVYRPCSRDSIAKMLGTTGVGKGLNIKGKSAKKNMLSGFVPFLQISDNRHKSHVEASPRAARTHVYFRNVVARQTAEGVLNEVMRSAEGLDIEERTIFTISECEPQTFGLDVPEPVIKEAYIMRPDISPVIGWETGRASEPAFMDMNLHSVRDGAAGKTFPNVVLYQFDLSDPMNPHGLLIAYAEGAGGKRKVKPVCSDFDTFTVGSKGFRYDPLDREKQTKLVHWTLDNTADLLSNPSHKGWMSRWLDVLKKSAQEGFNPMAWLPKYGFGDPTSYDLIGQVVDATASCGAVRHGAECFNFLFPQDLDDEFLVVWDGFTSPPWKSFKEPELRSFLIDRCKDGYSFPINPVWPIRDNGWHDVLKALQSNDEGKANLASWWSDPSILERIEKMCVQFPNGFQVTAAPPESLKSQKSLAGHKLKLKLSTMNLLHAKDDLDTREMGYYVEAEVRGEINARWKRVRAAVKMQALLHKVNKSAAPEAS